MLNTTSVLMNEAAPGVLSEASVGEGEEGGLLFASALEAAMPTAPEPQESKAPLTVDVQAAPYVNPVIQMAVAALDAAPELLEQTSDVAALEVLGAPRSVPLPLHVATAPLDGAELTGADEVLVGDGVASGGVFRSGESLVESLGEFHREPSVEAVSEQAMPPGALLETQALARPMQNAHVSPLITAMPISELVEGALASGGEAGAPGVLGSGVNAASVSADRASAAAVKLSEPLRTKLDLTPGQTVSSAVDGGTLKSLTEGSNASRPLVDSALSNPQQTARSGYAALMVGVQGVRGSAGEPVQTPVFPNSSVNALDVLRQSKLFTEQLQGRAAPSVGSGVGSFAVADGVQVPSSVESVVEFMEGSVLPVSGKGLASMELAAQADSADEPLAPVGLEGGSALLAGASAGPADLLVQEGTSSVSGSGLSFKGAALEASQGSATVDPESGFRQELMDKVRSALKSIEMRLPGQIDVGLQMKDGEQVVLKIATQGRMMDVSLQGLHSGMVDSLGDSHGQIAKILEATGYQVQSLRVNGEQVAAPSSAGQSGFQSTDQQQSQWTSAQGQQSWGQQGQSRGQGQELIADPEGLGQAGRGSQVDLMEPQADTSASSPSLVSLYV